MWNDDTELGIILETEGLHIASCQAGLRGGTQWHPVAWDYGGWGLAQAMRVVTLTPTWWKCKLHPQIHVLWMPHTTVWLFSHEGPSEIEISHCAFEIEHSAPSHCLLLQVSWHCCSTSAASWKCSVYMGLSAMWHFMLELFGLALCSVWIRTSTSTKIII